MFAPLFILIAFLLSLSVHEAAHAYVADRLGDPSARLAGRVSLNPLVHLDPIGTLLPLFLLLTGSPIVFGWGKPVPFDPYNLQRPRRDTALISVSGALANLSLAVILAVIARLTNAYALLVPVITLNITWALFNLIPIHPLDGGKVLVGLLPQKIAYQWDEVLNRYGTIILIFLIFPFLGRSLLFTLLGPLVSLITNLLLPGAPLV
ncbi:site-2 protease family protein [Candidatus Shapirobacteria bacterium CG09_land_8_20_14_0_10_49_15]|uniref:Site-2 protease family protein n=2 Tax=Candidatus Shapironibacteriota TaxID=1752721 RepID=A0A2M8L7B2_9BACT|nr:MAG: site-2 protease family protein [Candidatus Shapirobacteria bacterium CG09_land_8_20_14_0_10_49_15]PJE70112.1 MAG: site-2 protease family protein [Candidatus Shapirobacteria bacterium CG10_big_fil_rev_8_21_14_0_10_48_15]